MKLKRLHWILIFVGLGLAGTIYAKENREFDECLRGIHVDVFAIEGETTQEHYARMDEAEAADCRTWT